MATQDTENSQGIAIVTTINNRRNRQLAVR